MTAALRAASQSVTTIPTSSLPSTLSSRLRRLYRQNALDHEGFHNKPQAVTTSASFSVTVMIVSVRWFSNVV